MASRIETLPTHSLFKSITTKGDLRCFMEHHAFAVWDCMSLVKSLQQQLTGVTTPWTPVVDPATCRFVNEIVLDEESDELPDGTVTSHFELYLAAMEAAGADTDPARAHIVLIDSQTPLPAAMDKAGVPLAAQRFVEYTMSVVNHGLLHQVAATFVVGRTVAIPQMFAGIVHDSNLHDIDLLHEYLDRHIDRDVARDRSSGMAMIERLCGKDTQRWDEATSAAIAALEARLNLWNGIEAAIDSRWRPQTDAVITGGRRLSFPES